MIPGIQARQQRRMLIKSWPPQPAFMNTGMGGSKIANKIGTARERFSPMGFCAAHHQGSKNRLTQDVKKHVSGR